MEVDRRLGVGHLGHKCKKLKKDIYVKNLGISKVWFGQASKGQVRLGLVR